MLPLAGPTETLTVLLSCPFKVMRVALSLKGQTREYVTNGLSENMVWDTSQRVQVPG